MSLPSRTYIGPFGRILPLLPDTQPLASEEQHAPIEGTPSKMTTYHLPPPAGLQFGSDPFEGFKEPKQEPTNRDRASSDEQRAAAYQDQARRLHHEQLPSVRQLLTPGSQTSIPTSPCSPQHSPQSPESEPPNRRSTAHQRPPQVTHFNQQASFVTVPDPQCYSEPSFPVKAGYNQFVPPPQIQTPYPMAVPPNLAPYVGYHVPMQQDQHPHQPRQVAPLTTPNQYYQQPVSSYQPPFAPQAGPSQIVRDAANNIKPLPRLVGEQIVPGEGPCWVYEDGSFCKKEIDGEPVNGQWGVTKAGKPRKRLAIACTTCREKKIKCDPAEPKCVQCEKFGRICRFTTARVLHHP